MDLSIVKNEKLNQSQSLTATGKRYGLSSCTEFTYSIQAINLIRVKRIEFPFYFLDIFEKFQFNLL